MIPYIDARLRSWAEWRLAYHDSGVGFPRQVSWSKFRVDNSTSMPAGFADDAYEMDQAISEIDSYLKQVVEVCYLRTATVQQKANECQCGSIQTYYNRLQRAHERIMEWLNLHS